MLPFQVMGTNFVRRSQQGMQLANDDGPRQAAQRSPRRLCDREVRVIAALGSLLRKRN